MTKVVDSTIQRMNSVQGFQIKHRSPRACLRANGVKQVFLQLKLIFPRAKEIDKIYLYRLLYISAFYHVSVVFYWCK